MAQNLTVKKGQCINFGNCSKANAREMIEINLGDDFICPECDGGLMEPPPKKGFPSALKWILIIIGMFVLLGVGCYFIWSKAIPSDLKCKFFSIDCPSPIPQIEHPITPDGITLDITSLAFDSIGANKQLTATILPDDVPEKNKMIIWQSDNEAVATVDDNGNVTAVANGNIIISAYSGNGFSATCDVKVDDVKVDDGKIIPDPNPIHGTISVTGGSYSGELKNRQPHGMGTIRYNSRTLIDSRDTKKRYAEAGQSLTGQFRNGRLLQGKLFDSNGNQIETIIIGGGAY